MNANDYGFWLFCTSLVAAGLVTGLICGTYL
jgi:hypothetical protein